MKFHTFYTDNFPEKIVEQHSNCCNRLKIAVEYHKVPYALQFLTRYKQHGELMNWLLSNSNEDVVCFLDLDCLPHDKNTLQQAFEWVSDNHSFCGNAQNVSHINMRNHVYAAASMLMIHKKAWNYLGNPSLSCVFENELTQIDTAQLLTLKADQLGFPYQLMYPIGYDGPDEYKLAGYGMYGTGTLYPGTYHLFALSENVKDIPEIWNQRVSNILNSEKIIPKHSSIYYGL